MTKSVITKKNNRDRPNNKKTKSVWNCRWRGGISNGLGKFIANIYDPSAAAQKPYRRT